MSKQTNKVEAIETSTLNVYQKLIKARVKFLEAAPKKSGKHLQLEFKYFELDDIVPAATRIFDSLGLVYCISFTNESAIGVLFNTENPDEKIEFTSPMTEPEPIESKTGKQVTSKIQALGAAHTYQRRYLWLLALDVVESDVVDGGTTSETPTKSKTVAPKAPVTTETRDAIKKDIVGTEEPAHVLQINALKAVLKKLRELDPTQDDFIQTIALKTEKFTKISKKACENLIIKIGEMLEAYKDKAAKTEVDEV